MPYVYAFYNIIVFYLIFCINVLFFLSCCIVCVVFVCGVFFCDVFACVVFVVCFMTLSLFDLFSSFPSLNSTSPLF